MTLFSTQPRTQIESLPLTYKLKRNFIPEDSRPGIFYLLPKIYQLNNPDHPIDLNIGCLTENVSGYVESLLKLLAQSAKFFVKDTCDFLLKLQKNWSSTV